MRHSVIGIAVGLGLATLAAGCAGAPDLSPAARPLSKSTMMQLGKMGINPGAPMFVRIFKEESELEVWKQRDDGRFYHFKTYPICNWSGTLGPKLKQGDRQAPEGFYTVSKDQMNPNSQFYLAFNVGFPNAYDRVNGRTGSALMVHGKCKSAGCYAMTDALIEEIYALARESFDAGHPSFDVHAYPFRMTEANMARHRSSKWYDFWQIMKAGYDTFETTHVPPPITVCARQYQVNAKPVRTVANSVDPASNCPPLERPIVEPFIPRGDQQVAQSKLVAPGPKRRTAIASEATTSPQSSSSGGMYGLLKGMMAPSRPQGFAFGSQ
ncbi:MAG: murein L,D-transpeptidase family protein [Hyphomicrobiaceae bacterium]